MRWRGADLMLTSRVDRNSIPFDIMKAQFVLPLFASTSLLAAVACAGETSPASLPGQLPRAMHMPMSGRPHITVGLKEGDISGADNRALQASVDYVSSLGGGTVEIGPGEYVMRDSLHLRSEVTLRGVAGKTVLRKARSVASALKVDGDYGEEQFTVENPAG